MEDQNEKEEQLLVGSEESLLETLSVAKFQDYVTDLMDWAVLFLPKLLLACLILFIGFKIVNKIGLIVKGVLNKANLGVEVTDFLHSAVTFLMKLIVIGLAASIIGVKMTALIGLFGAAVFAIGMALQGFMGNFASGLTILFLKPYKVGDWISIDESFGKVKSIQIFITTLETPNDKTLIIPNGQATDNVITNYSSVGEMRLELNVNMPYEESFPRVKDVIHKALKKSQYVLWNRAPKIGIKTNDTHYIVLAIRPYIHPDDYWNATYELYALIKEGFSQNDIKAAYSEGVELGPIGV